MIITKYGQRSFDLVICYYQMSIRAAYDLENDMYYHVSLILSEDGDLDELNIVCIEDDWLRFIQRMKGA